MELNVTLVIVAVTTIVSLIAFGDKSLKYSLTFSPYSVKHSNRWWLVLTHGFIHADYTHLFFNMYVLYNFGNLVEETFIGAFGLLNGTFYFIGMYFGGLIFATLPAMRKHSDNPGYLSLGASGAVSAVVFATIIMYPTGKMALIFLPAMPSFIFGLIYLAGEYYMNKRGGSGIAHDAHMAGALFGMAYLAFVDYHIYIDFIIHLKAWFADW